MSAATHHVEVLEKSGTNLRLRLYIVHPDEHSFCLKKNCALQILWDQTHPAFGVLTALADAISVTDRLDAQWLLDNEERFIHSVELLETKNYPVPADLNFNKHMEDKSALPQAIVEIRVTDERWIEHLEQGMKWETAPYDAEFYV